MRYRLHRNYPYIPPLFSLTGRGQALITLLFYVMIILVITTGAVMLIATNALSTTRLQESILAYSVAEAGAENAVIRVLRDPSYAGETNLAVGEGDVDIEVTPGNPVVIVSTGTLNNFKRKIEVSLTRTSGFYNILSWKEIP